MFVVVKRGHADAHRVQVALVNAKRQPRRSEIGDLVEHHLRLCARAKHCVEPRYVARCWGADGDMRGSVFPSE